MTTEPTELLPSAADNMKKIALAEAEKARAYVAKQAAAEAAQRELMGRLQKPTGISDEERLVRAPAIIRRAVYNRLTEVLRALGAKIATGLTIAIILLYGADQGQSADQSISEKELIIGTKEAPPFVMKRSDGTLYGISIDLWRRMAEQLHLRYHFSEQETIQGLLKETEEGAVDAAIAALTTTAARERVVDFTQPFYSTGLGIAVPASEDEWTSVLRTMLSFGFFQAVLALLGIAICVGFSCAAASETIGRAVGAGTCPSPHREERWGEGDARRSLGAFTGGRGRGRMADMTEDFDGERIARQRIAEEAERRTGFLDLSQLGLTELPAELFALTHLRRLHLGWRLEQRHGVWGRADWGDNSHPNRFDGKIEPFRALPWIEAVSISGTDWTSLDTLGSCGQLNWFDCSDTPVADLAPLAKLSALQTLSCSNTQVADLAPLAKLSALQTLSCSNTQVADLAPLAKLSALQTLSCSNTQVADLAPLAKLSALQTLSCSNTQVADLAPLAKLSALQTLSCSNTQVADLAPLAKLSALQTLSCSNTQVADLAPLAKLSALQTLSCSNTQVADLAPLAKLSALQTLSCYNTQVADLAPLAKLSALQTLSCYYTQVADLAPLAKLSALQTLSCYNTQVADLAPLAKLSALQTLDCSGCKLASMPAAILDMPSLTNLVLYGSTIPGVPPAALSQNPYDNCLDALRTHFLDQASGAEDITDVKLLLLGNGRSGKTQLARRLAGQPFQKQWDSTHGIRVPPAALLPPDRGAAPNTAPTRLNIWDFGGQDIYHGTHALFVRSRAVFVLVWATDTEGAETYEHQGITFRNHPLAYWVDYVRHVAQAESPVVIVQTKCDRAADEEELSDHVANDALKALWFRREVRFSAENDRGRDELEAALRAAIAWLRDEQGIARIGKGRLRVQRRIEGLRNEDGSLPGEWRLVDKATFQAWCDEEAGEITSAEALIGYLHNAGTVFYREGSFDDRIVLDHAWAMNAIYAVFDRTRCYRLLVQAKGQFTRPLLAALIWNEQGHTPDDQRLFLGMMRSCGICFIYRAGPDGSEDDDETVYIAPDLLPDRQEVARELEIWWDVDAAGDAMTFDYPLLHAGLMRAVIARIGDKAGLDAIYWRGGVCVYETTTKSRAMIEESMTKGAWRGTVRLATKGSQGAELMERLAGWIAEENERLGLRPEVTGGAPGGQLRPHPEEAAPAAVSKDGPGSARASILRDARRRRAPQDEAGSHSAIEHRDAPSLRFGAEPGSAFGYFVSYAWGDDTPDGKERDAYVDKLCAEAGRRNIRILRDRNEMGLGDRISEFMRALGQGKRVFVILSDKYLRSPFCTFELFEVWRNSRMDDEEFKRRVRIFKIPGVNIRDFREQRRYYDYWKQELADQTALTAGVDLADLPDIQLKRLQAMKQFTSQILKILGGFADTIQPADWQEFLDHGFDDSPP